jgi:hypothetical protein
MYVYVCMYVYVQKFLHRIIHALCVYICMYMYIYVCIYRSSSQDHARTMHRHTLNRTPAHTQVCQVAGNMDDASSFDRTKQALHFIGFDQQVCMCV